MESFNISNMQRIAGGDPDGKRFRMPDYTERPEDVSAPWYTGDFDETYNDLHEGIEGFFQFLKERGELR